VRTDGQRERERRERERERDIDRNGEDFSRFSQYSADPLNKEILHYKGIYGFR